MDKEPKKGITRRGLLLGGGAAAAMTGAGVIASKMLGPRETLEGPFRKSEQFEDNVKGYQVLYGELERDEVLFVDSRNRPVGGPIKLPSTMLDTNGFPKGRSLDQAWLNAERQNVCTRHKVPCDIQRSLPRQMNTIQGIREAVQTGLNPRTFVDIVKQNGNKQTIGGGGLNRIEYVRAHAMHGRKLPETIRKELSDLLPGLAAQESRFNNDSVSTAGARGIFQFLPGTWKELGYQPNDIRLLTKQVEAVGAYFERAHGSIIEQCETTLRVIRSEYFRNDQEFETHFLVPVLLNAYNAGPARMAAVVNWFVQQFPTKSAFEKRFGAYPNGYGHDVFHAMTSLAALENGAGTLRGYRKHASEYVPRLHALAQLIKSPNR